MYMCVYVYIYIYIYICICICICICIYIYIYTYIALRQELGQWPGGVTRACRDMVFGAERAAADKGYVYIYIYIYICMYIIKNDK